MGCFDVSCAMPRLARFCAIANVSSVEACLSILTQLLSVGAIMELYGLTLSLIHI